MEQCPTCGGELVRIDKFDAYACLKCDVWTEGQCGGAKCEFCVGRPERPSMVKSYEPL